MYKENTIYLEIDFHFYNCSFRDLQFHSEKKPKVTKFVVIKSCSKLFFQNRCKMDAKASTNITTKTKTNQNLFRYIHNRYLLRFFDCLAHPNLGAPFATDQKWPLCHLHISYQSLAGGLRSLQKSEFLKLIISCFHYFCSQNWNQWKKQPYIFFLLLVQK